ncbi:uncharacterized protein F4817DRAFT_312189 [Daldinia loculata]|uniref:uncharacterized protein n=1 Tax=Daldinia loculata TaxID=103429 RepID=UPI0020C2EC16|nr:uncharacterized protein F4817DRAFT_312189 [Daldinia loculata]KAI1650831.1 hypothetical protein F4817DRAFT_312189 [Daldinia loculata]
MSLQASLILRSYLAMLAGIALAAKLKDRGAEFVAAPGFGATPVAAAGQLLSAFGGSKAVYEKVSPFLKGVIAREVLLVGEEPEKATLLKTTGNFLMASLMELNFGTVAHSDSVRMTTGVYVPGKDQTPWSGLDLAFKDVGHDVDCAARASVRLEVANTALEHLRRAKEYLERNRGRRLDSSSLYGRTRDWIL